MAWVAFGIVMSMALFTIVMNFITIWADRER